MTPIGLNVAERLSFVVALVGAVGAPLKETSEQIEEAASKYAYAVRRIHLSEALAFVTEDIAEAAAREVEVESYFKDLEGEYGRVRQAMARGTATRTAFAGADDPREEKNACLGYLAVRAIAEHRKKLPHAACYVVDSIKTVAELELLREVYGRRLLVVGVHSPKVDRQLRVGARIQLVSGRSPRTAEAALHLIGIDEKERGTSYGQDVQGGFERCDVYVHASQRDQDFRSQIERLAGLAFLEPFETPTSDESAMSHAYGASLQSSSMARQVGAAIVAKTGEVLSMGFNEVPKYGGNPYSGGSGVDGRDWVRGHDENSVQKRALLHQILAVAEQRKLLREGLAVDTAVKAIEDHSPAKDMLWSSITEYCREVHAEMAAIGAAARLGVSVRGGTLFTTTFPCHNCAKHIVAAGLDEVVFIEAYPKSFTEAFHSDSIAVDEARPGKVLIRGFRGVAPRSYPELFGWRERRDDRTGGVQRRAPADAKPWFTQRTHLSDREISQREEAAINKSRQWLSAVFNITDALKILTEGPKGEVRSPAQIELFPSRSGEAMAQGGNAHQTGRGESV